MLSMSIAWQYQVFGLDSLEEEDSEMAERLIFEEAVIGTGQGESGAAIGKAEKSPEAADGTVWPDGLSSEHAESPGVALGSLCGDMIERHDDASHGNPRNL